ncbi:hypothetical protein ONZ45_g3748 [Pleurotus djamor]|nr:hypothetical protein ONZ45_g3748 [Pleurotus djamor]
MVSFTSILHGSTEAKLLSADAMPAFSMPFPVELVEIVISFVDYKTLSPCSLVSKTWAAICQPGFFSDLTVNYEEPYGTKRRLKRLNKIFADSPHLARHFEEVTLDLYSFHAAPKAFDKYLPSILDRLTHVESFHIISKAFNFEDFSLTMAEAIFSMLSRCPLEKLQLTRTGFESLETLLSLFTLCSESLQELDLSRVYFEADEEEFHDAALDPIEFPCLQTAVFDSED